MNSELKFVNYDGCSLEFDGSVRQQLWTELQLKSICGIEHVFRCRIFFIHALRKSYLFSVVKLSVG